MDTTPKAKPLLAHSVLLESIALTRIELNFHVQLEPSHLQQEQLRVQFVQQDLPALQQLQLPAMLVNTLSKEKQLAQPVRLVTHVPPKLIFQSSVELENSLPLVPPLALHALMETNAQISHLQLRLPVLELIIKMEPTSICVLSVHTDTNVLLPQDHRLLALLMSTETIP